FEIKFYKPNYDNIEKYKRWQETFKKCGSPTWHYSIFIKLDIPFILKHLDNVLFIDADSIVLESLDYIFDMDISNYYCIVPNSNFKNLNKIHPKLYKWINEIGFNADTQYLMSVAIFFNLKKIREEITLDKLAYKIDECFNKYGNIIFTDEHVLMYMFSGHLDFINMNTDIDIDTSSIKIVSVYFASSVGKPLSLNFNKPINDYYYKFWEYLSLTQFFKDNYFKYLDYFNSARVNKSYSAILKLVDKIVWIIPMKSMRDKIRNNIVKDIKKILDA
ncbi:glycosyltransferase, partial [Brachyspira pulli]|uniref:glycosyltransferase n=1 Tax=Brachyspira pulli TaxID=310721 RepID=UPI00300616E0